MFRSLTLRHLTVTRISKSNRLRIHIVQQRSNCFLKKHSHYRELVWEFIFTLYNICGRWMIHKYTALGKWHCQGKQRYLERNMTECHFVHRIFHIDWPEIEADHPLLHVFWRLDDYFNAVDYGVWGWETDAPLQWENVSGRSTLENYAY